MTATTTATATTTLAETTPAVETVRCLRCGRVLTNPVSRERGMGRTCYGRDQATRTELASLGASPSQIDWVTEALSDGAVIPLFEDLVLIVATDGDDLYCASPTGCSCPAGHRQVACKHLVLARYALSA